MPARPAKYFAISLFILPLVVAWLFVPSLADAFKIKSYVATLAILGLAFADQARPAPSTWVIPRGLTGIAFGLLMLAILLSASLSGNSYLAGTTLVEFIPYIVLVFCLVNLPDAEPTLTYIEYGILCAALGVAVFGLKQFFFPHFLDPGFHALGKMQNYSTLGNPNLSAISVLAALPITLHHGLRGHGWRRALYATAFFILGAYLAIAQSRHAWLALVIMGLAAATWLGSRAQRGRLLMGIGIALGAVVLLLQYVEIPGALAHAARGRWFIWRTAWEMLWDHPMVGVGLGQFGLQHIAYQGKLFSTGGFDAFRDNAAVIEDAHNQFLHWGATTGVFGLVGFSLLCLAALWKGWHSEKLKKNFPSLYIGFIGYVVVMFFTTALSTAGTALLFWLLLGALLRQSDLPLIHWQVQRRARYILLACLAGLMAISITWTWREVTASYYQAQANQLMHEHDLWLATQRYRAALAWHPQNGVLLKEHATALFLAGHLDEALQELVQAERYSGDLGIPVLAGEIQTRLGDYAAAVATYQRITSAFPNMASPHFMLAQIYAVQGKKQQADGEFRRVLAIRPSPYNLNMTTDKVDLQKQIARAYLQDRTQDGPARALDIP